MLWMSLEVEDLSPPNHFAAEGRIFMDKGLDRSVFCKVAIQSKSRSNTSALVC